MAIVRAVVLAAALNLTVVLPPSLPLGGVPWFVVLPPSLPLGGVPWFVV
eukprot:gene30633-25313_t